MKDHKPSVIVTPKKNRLDVIQFERLWMQWIHILLIFITVFSKANIGKWWKTVREHRPVNALCTGTNIMLSFYMLFIT